GSSSGVSKQGVTVTATSSNPGLIPNPSVTYMSPDATGSLSFAPAANVFGAATITVTVNNGQIQNNTISLSFTVTVHQPPFISPITNQVTAQNTSLSIQFSISDEQTNAYALTLQASCYYSFLVD